MSGPALKRALAAIVLVLSLAAPVAAGPLEDAKAAYSRGDYTTALRIFRPLANQGDAVAQALLGHMYDRGRGVPQNSAEAVKWYRLAAEQGLADAQALLGNMYAEGEGVRQNYAEALKWYRLAANQGDAFAQNLLGALNRDGQYEMEPPVKPVAPQMSQTLTPEEIRGWNIIRRILPTRISGLWQCRSSSLASKKGRPTMRGRSKSIVLTWRSIGRDKSPMRSSSATGRSAD